MRTLFTNTEGPDCVGNAFYLFSDEPCDVFLISPFFSNAKIIGVLTDRNCSVRLIVRLGPATDPTALRTVSRFAGVQVRFYTSNLFHTKLYIFGQKAAVVGSANLTESGLMRNREVAAVIDPEDERFDTLLGLFQRYWVDAKVLTPDRLDRYENIYRKDKRGKRDPIEADVTREFGDTVPSGVQVGRPKASKEKVYLESYRRTYQEFLEAFRIVEDRYRLTAKRHQPEEVVPLRIEIDQFLSFIREEHTTGDSYYSEPIRHGTDLEQHVDRYLEDWFNQRWSYLDEKIPLHYRQITNKLGSLETIESASAEELFDALDICHSIHDRLRFSRGGHSALKETFLKENDVFQVKKVLKYLLHGPGDYVTRLGACIFEEAYQLRQFGRSAVQEVFGWVNREEVPICNGRTMKALRYLGFNVLVFN